MLAKRITIDGRYATSVVEVEQDNNVKSTLYKTKTKKIAGKLSSVQKDTHIPI